MKRSAVLEQLTMAIHRETGIKREGTRALKGIAILTVILSHASAAGFFERVPLFSNKNLMSLFCEIGMSVFLILSGYGVMISFLEKGMEKFWDKKFLNIFFPAIFIQCVYLCIRMLQDYFNGGVELDFQHLFSDVLCVGQTNGIDATMWYLSYLIFCYISFYFFFQYIHEIKKAFWGFVIFWVLATPAMIKLWHNAFYCVISFGLGVSIAYFLAVMKVRIEFAKTGILITLFVVIFIGYFVNYRVNYLLDNIASVLTRSSLN